MAAYPADKLARVTATDKPTDNSMSRATFLLARNLLTACRNSPTRPPSQAKKVRVYSVRTEHNPPYPRHDLKRLET